MDNYLTPGKQSVCVVCYFSPRQLSDMHIFLVIYILVAVQC
ncbi:hypothetical protein ERHA54_04890 [Erwinia rhapontici]|nr:hypothetical protein ERHA54_04890 [Erwinia rhapontici]